MTGPLPRADSLSVADGFIIYSSANIGFYYIPTSLLLTFLNANLTFPTPDARAQYVSQYAAPSASGFNVPITPATDQDVHLILTPTAGYAAGTITLPPVAGCRDGQRVLVNCTQQVTALTINGNGATAVTGEPTSLGADDFFTMMFDSLMSTWYRVG